MRRTLAVIGVLALLTAACGDDDDGGNGGDALSEDEYIERVCGVGDDIREATQDIESPDADDFDQIVESDEEAREAVDQALEDLDELPPPSEFEDAHDEVRAFVEEYRGLLDDQIAAAEDEDQDAVEDTGQEIGDLFEGAEFELDDDCNELDDSSDASDTSDFSDLSDFTDSGSEVDACGEPSSGEVEPGENVTGAVEESGDVVSFDFTGEGSPVDIAVDQTDDEFDPVLTVCDSDGNEVDRDDDGGGYPNSLISDFEAEDGEEYLLAVSGFFGESTGEFELTVS